MATIYFRTDGNEEIATGHIMRCLSIARECVKQQAKVCFLTADETSTALLHARFLMPEEFPVVCLHSDYRNMEAELPALVSFLTQDNALEKSLLFIDSYFVTASYFTKLKQLCPVAYLDDMLAFSYPADLVINYDVSDTSDNFSKVQTLFQAIPQCLLGASYTPLREQFQAVSYEVKPQVQTILLSTGGTDSYNVAGTILERIFSSDTPAMAEELPQEALWKNAIHTLQHCHYYVVTSALNSHYEQLKEWEQKYPSIHIAENIQDMASLMKECDLAVSAGGTTLSELCAVGVPAISFAIADNQLTAVETFASHSLIPYAGDIRTAKEQTIANLLTFLAEQSSLPDSYEERKKSSQNMRAFIDGKGSVRIAQALLTLADK